MAHKSGSTSGFAIGVGMADQGSVGVGTGFSNQKSGVAKLTAPPTKDTGIGESIALIFIALVIFNFVGVVVFFILSSLLNADSSNLTIWIVSLFVGAIAAGVFCVAMWKRYQARELKIEAAYKAAMKKWEHSWLCLKCGNSFYVR